MKKIPTSTYRLQLCKEFDFEAAAAAAEYLQALGVSEVYCSPYLQAAPGSAHGYDVVDHRTVNEELGGSAAHEAWSAQLQRLGLGQILDIVPNHMSLCEQNRYWWDVLENGASSRYASFFDINWTPAEERLRDKVLVPILSDQYGRALSAGEVKIVRLGAEFRVDTAGQHLPVSPTSLAMLLNRAAERVRSDLLSFVGASFARLPSPEFWDRRMMLARNRDKVVLYALLARLCKEELDVCEAIDTVVQQFNADPDLLHDLLQQQHYRLAYWKTADQQLGYRRFFDVNTLIGMRVEREFVFEETHALILQWLQRGVLNGVRVDHPDGLRDPKQYFQRLRERAPDAWIVAEKILEPGEYLRPDWPIDGTTGYDFLNAVTRVLVQSAGMRELAAHYVAFTGDVQSFATVAHDKKLTVTQEALGSDVNRLASVFVDLCEASRDQRDFTRAEIRRAIREVASCFRVYRTYVVPERDEITEEDRSIIEAAVEAAKANRQDIDPGLFDFMRDVLTLRATGKLESEFVYVFQQFTGPVMAKGVEDTAFYASNALVALNEVGGDPAHPLGLLDEFHEHQRHVQQATPQTMTTLSTHDTKRSDDVRARLLVLSELPDQWSEMVLMWSELGARYRDDAVLDRGTEWFLYQTIVGAWSIDAQRLRSYMQKAMREAKLRTSWVAGNAEYEQALEAYIDALLHDPIFVASVERFVQQITPAGRNNSLAQTLLKYTAPGVPDLYQGGELWDLTLVDPDNRRPVDYARRRQLLSEIQSMSAKDVMLRMEEGLPKLWLIHRALLLRREHPEWFDAHAGYTAVMAQGVGAERVIASLRGESVLSIAPRWTYGNQSLRGTTVALPRGTWRNVLSDGEALHGAADVGALVEEFPVALLVKM
jgi:(1->4)-alpha-D-glucan 1-alpha-D-glucosylmutase